MRISITGANGFLGNKLVKTLDKQGYHVIAWMRDPSMSGYHKDCRVFDLEQCNIKLDDSDILIHCAAYIPSNYENISEAEKCMNINGLGTLKLLQAAERAGIKKFIHISTGQLYSWSKPTSEATEIEAMYPTERASPYLVSKFAGELYVDSYKHRLKTIILRPSYIYGSGMKSTGLLHRITTSLKSGEHINMKKIGIYNVDLVHVNDVVNMISLCLNNENISGIYNIGGGEAISTRELIHSLAGIMGKNAHTISENLDLDRCHPALNINKAVNVGYTPTNLMSGLSEYWESIK